MDNLTPSRYINYCKILQVMWRASEHYNGKVPFPSISYDCTYAFYFNNITKYQCENYVKNLRLTGELYPDILYFN